MSEHTKEMLLGCGLVLFSLALYGLGFAFGHSNAADHIGQKSEVCFANNSCRTGLTCLHGDGAEPGVCVTTPDLGAE